jgi:hypothetical protein
MEVKRRSLTLCALALAAVAHGADAQTKSAQVVKPPIAQAWIDVATFTGFGMSAGGSPMAAIGGMFGGGQSGGNEFGRTQSGMAGRWVDVTLSTRNNPDLAQATQSVPEGTQLAPRLQLVAPERAPLAPARDDEVVERDYERPKGKAYLYWGCSETVRPGQPRVVDFATATPQDIASVFQSRRATQRGAHSAAGRPLWPSKIDKRPVPDGASLVGEHAFGGQGVPEGFRFAIASAQDLMPAIELAQSEGATATLLEWKPVPHARAYFIAAMGSRGGGSNAEIVFWSSSELPDTGQGLLDYQTNAAVDRWLNEKVLLAPATTKCAIPKGIFGEAGMLRMIAYGTEMNVVHPPRPTDPKIAWEPQWAAKVRVKSVYQGMVGMDMPAMAPRGRAAQPESAPAEAEPAKKDEPRKPSALDILRGVLGK